MTTRAQTPVERPALDVPPAPPRIIEPAPPPTAEVIDQVPQLPPEEQVTAPPKPRPAPAPAARDTQKPELKPETPAVEALVAQQPPAVPLLRTPATANTVAAERQIRETLTKAERSLYSVDFDRLTSARQKAYNEAKDFITEAENQLSVSNLEAAKELADKAEKYATLLLQGR